MDEPRKPDYTVRGIIFAAVVALAGLSAITVVGVYQFPIDPVAWIFLVMAFGLTAAILPAAWKDWNG